MKATTVATVVVAVLSSGTLPWVASGCAGHLADPESYGSALGEGSDGGCPDVPTQIFAKNCVAAGCHGGSLPAAGLDLSVGHWDDLVGRNAAGTCAGRELLIDPEAPEKSLLYALLDRRTKPATCGLVMPFGALTARAAGEEPSPDKAALLPESERRCVLTWIKSLIAGPAPDAGSDSEAPGPDGSMEDVLSADEGGRDARVPATDADDAGSPTAGGYEYVEAESGIGATTQPMTTADDTMASGGRYLWTPAETADSAVTVPVDGHVVFTFPNLPEGTYKLWGRFMVGARGADGDSLWVRIDDRPWINWNDITRRIGNTDWGWDEVHDAGMAFATVAYDLGSGKHTVEIAYREATLKIDRFLLTNDPAMTPQ